MNRYTSNFSHSSFLFLLFFFYSFSSKAQNITISQDAKFDQLLNEKRKINSSITANSSYKIQVFNGNSEASKKALTDFRKGFKNYDATIVFSTPSYKVWIGNFRTRIEAEHHLIILQKKYPNAIIIKPNKP
jgi:hypothetical protein